ncbi:MAG: methyl-accepting chemotaxis protein [Bacillota bacterium]
MRLSRLFNPLQWNFRPRTIATLVTWAVLPVLLVGFAVLRGFQSAALEAGLQPDQVDLLAQKMRIDALQVTLPLILVAIAASILFSNLVVRPILRLQQGMEQIARGDLSAGAIPVTSMDEVGRITAAYNEMATRLTEMVRTMATTSGSLDTAAGQLGSSARESNQAIEASSHEIESVRQTSEQQALQVASGTRAVRELMEAAGQVAAGAQAQAQEVERAAETVREMAEAIEQVAASAGVVSGAAGRTRKAAEDGRQAVQLSAEGMDQVRARVLDAAEKLRHLSQSLSHVDEILQLITEIAGQTDLLALNAAIEAARVGEHGKGFAVVATEVRRLAERSRTAAGEITGRIEALRHGADAVVETMEAGTRDVEQGVLLSRKAGEALEGILAAVAETQAQVESISAASEEIAAASSQVVNATVQLSAIAEENAAAAEQMLSSAQEVTALISGVEEGSRRNHQAVESMATSSLQVRTTVGQMVELAERVAQTATALRKQAEQFRF